MATRILLTGLCLLLTTRAQQNSTPAPTLAATTADSTAAPTVEASRSTSTPAASSNTTAPTAGTAAPKTETAAPTFLSRSNTSSSPASTEVPSVVPTPAPTTTTIPTPSPTPSPTPPPTFSASSYCERPYQWSNDSVTPCAELASPQDRESGVGVFYDEKGCGPEAESTSVVGCSFAGEANCRVCVFYRELYSTTILGGADVPFVDCPCCVPELYGMGGDINCNFTTDAVPVEPATTPSPAEASAGTSASMAPGGRSTSNDTSTTLAPTVTPIPMEPCEIGVGGDTTADSTLCVDVASRDDWGYGIGAFYEENCEGVGCDIAGNADCRRCIFDNTAYEAHLQSTGSEGQALVDCPCCVPITYKLRPGDSECVWPATPSPTPAPTTYEEFLENSGGAPSRPRGLTVAAAAAGAPLAMIAATVAVGVATACFVASIEVAGSHDPWVKTEMPRGKPA